MQLNNIETLQPKHWHFPTIGTSMLSQTKGTLLCGDWMTIRYLRFQDLFYQRLKWHKKKYCFMYILHYIFTQPPTSENEVFSVCVWGGGGELILMMCIRAVCILYHTHSTQVMTATV